MNNFFNCREVCNSNLYPVNQSDIINIISDSLLHIRWDIKWPPSPGSLHSLMIVNQENKSQYTKKAKHSGTGNFMNWFVFQAQSYMVRLKNFNLFSSEKDGWEKKNLFLYYAETFANCNCIQSPPLICI